MAEIYPFKEAEQYVNLLQENITRMASNSANCKNWLMGIIGGTLAIMYSSNASPVRIDLILCVLEVFTLLFYFLDSFYLGIERRFRKAEELFITKCKEKNESDVRLLLMSFKKTLIIEGKSADGCTEQLKKMKGQIKDTFCAMGSLSTFPFYGVILFMLLVID